MRTNAVRAEKTPVATRGNRWLRARAAWPAAALGLLFASGCKQSPPPQTVVTVQAEHPRLGSISAQVAASAVLAPVAQAAIAPRISAPVAKFYVVRGERVHAGQLLATLDNQDLEAAALESKGAYEAAQATYETAVNAQVPEEQLKAEAALAAARATLDLDQSTVESREKLFAEGAIAGHDLDAAKAALVQARGAYNAARRHMEAVKSVTRAAAIQAAKGRLASAKGAYEAAEAQLDYSRIRSPIDGYVTERPLFAGETAPAGTPLITVMETRTLVARMHIAASEAQELRVGGAARIIIPGSGVPGAEGTGTEQSVPAKVSMISPALDPGSATVEVWLTVANKSGALKAGTPVQCSITGATVNHAIVIPLSAVLTAESGAKSVMVIAPDETAQPRQVTLGIDDGTDVQVVSGLTPSDEVITVGSYGLDPGTKVRVAMAQDASAQSGGDD